jgi:quercetin dioxygenase-like cupin family protein
MADASVVRNAGEGDAFWFLGGLYEVRLSSDETNGALTLMEFTIPEGMAPPLHMHDGDETVSVLEGSARFHIGEDTVELGPGSVVFLPAGTQETFEPIGQVRIQVAYTPGGIDKFFAEVGEPAATREVPPPPQGPPDFEHLAAAAEQHGLHLIPPPGA